MLLALNFFVTVIHDVTDEHVIWLIGQLDIFRNDWLQLLQRRVNNIFVNVLVTVDMLQKFFTCVVYTL